MNNELAEFVSRQWGLTGIAEVDEHSTYRSRRVVRIATDQGRFAVKVDTAPDAFLAGAEQVHAAMARAVPRHVPALRADKAGALVQHLAGQRVTVMEDIDGDPPPSTKQTWSELGSILARLHSSPLVEREFVIPVDQAITELQRHAKRYPFAQEFAAAVSRIDEIPAAPAAVIHGEVNLANVRKRSCGDLVLLDWDMAGTGPISLDLGYPLLSVFLDIDQTWWHENAAAFYSTYRRIANYYPPVEHVYSAGLLHAMRHIRWGDTVQWWARIQRAMRNRSEIMQVL